MIGCRLLTVWIPEPMIEGLDQALEDGFGGSRAELIRIAVRDFLSDLDLWGARPRYAIKRIPGPNEGIRLRRAPRRPADQPIEVSCIGGSS